jgi:hypothetical protein
MNGKGDTYRQVDKTTYDKNYDSINWGSKKKIKIRPYKYIEPEREPECEFCHKIYCDCEQKY